VPIPVDPTSPSATSYDGTTLVTSVPTSESVPDRTPLQADFAVVASRVVKPGSNFVVEIWVAQSSDHDKMITEATRSGRMVTRGNRSHVNVVQDALITVILKLPDFEVREPIEVLGWDESIRNASFIVKAGPSMAPGLYPGVMKLMIGQVPFASILFDLEIATVNRAETPRPLETRFERVARAFASYASPDRAEVLRRVQGIRAAGTDVFLDVIALRHGEKWEPALYREIDASDRFFLFWSRNAASSSWVEQEWRYALDRRGIDFIDPLPLEDPRHVPPPKELSSKHFNDMLLAFITSEEVWRSKT